MVQLPLRTLTLWLCTALAATCRAQQTLNTAATKEIVAGGSPQHILAIGDSLTTGFYVAASNLRLTNHPYTIKLGELLKSNGYNARVHERGKPKERVCGGLETRLPQLFQVIEPLGIRYSWIIIMEGANDIAGGARPQRVAQVLRELWGACGRHGARVLALTLTQSAAGAREPPSAPRGVLNDLIRNATAGSDFVTLLDADKLMPYSPDARDASGALLWSEDGVHPSAAGYDRLGSLVFEALRDKLQK